jgi:eukaryotic-like serine/threonine-protein kinase
MVRVRKSYRRNPLPAAASTRSVECRRRASSSAHLRSRLAREIRPGSIPRERYCSTPKRLNRGCFSVTIRSPSFQEYPLNTDAAGTAPPDAFGPFRVLHQIGAGALGPVFRAYQPEEDRLVAVKHFRIDVPPERAHQLVAQLERLIAADLTHAGIAAPIATGMVEVSPYLAMDFVAADSLDIVIRDQGLTAPSDVARVAAQLASALDLAASINITHGALHPRDVLVSADDVRITGIGIARALEEAGSSAPIRRPYTAPERSSGAAWDRRADVFSLAALIYELLTRRRISGPGDQSYDVFASVAGASADALDKVFDRALAEHPGDRFATAGDFAKALQSAVERKRSVAGRVGPAIRTPSPAPVVERTPSAPLPAEELPLFTDSMLGEKAKASPASDITPPPLMDAAHEALGGDLSFRDVPLSMVESLHEPERSNGDRSIDDFHTVAHDTGGDRLAIGDFTEVIRDESVQPPDRPLPMHLADLPGDRITEEPGPKFDPDFDINEVFAREAAEVPPPVEVASARPAPFESVSAVTASPSSSSGVWPLMLALVVGIALGFGMAMLLLGRDRVPPAPQQASAAPTSGSGATDVRDEPIREVTEQTIPTSPRPGAASQAVSPPPAAAAAPNAPIPPASANPKPATTDPATTPSKPAADRTDTRNTAPTAPTRPQGRTPVTAAKAAPTPPKPATAPVKPAPNAKPATNAAAKAAPTPAVGRGANKPVAVTPSKAAPQTPSMGETGTLVVESRPDGATIFLDGKRIGTTPLTLDVKVGQYTVGIDIPGYKRWASTVKVTSGERSRLAASLER